LFVTCRIDLPLSFVSVPPLVQPLFIFRCKTYIDLSLSERASERAKE